MSSLQRAREVGERALTGPKQVALEGHHSVRSLERPPPGTMSWIWGWCWSCLPQVGRRPGKPGRAAPRKRSSWTRRFWLGQRLGIGLGRRCVDAHGETGAGLRDREGEKTVGFWELFCKVEMQPLLGLMVLPLRTRAVAA
jgi:hypothetical protein